MREEEEKQVGPVPYMITNDSITVIWEGKPVVVRRGAPNFMSLASMLTGEDWDRVAPLLSVRKTIEDWAKGLFKFSGGDLSYKGEPLHPEFSRRVMAMVTEGSDPTMLLDFYESLQRNPSNRSVQQLDGFLRHIGLPIVEGGAFLAYKGVRVNFKDIHSGMFDNSPGQIHEMPRNKISDDPNYACHDGFHVGSLQYATDFGSAGRVVICKVMPENVVCVPHDHDQQKMRVCKYEVIGLHNGDALPSTTFEEDEHWYQHDDDDEEPGLGEAEESFDNEGVAVNTAEMVAAEPKVPKKKKRRAISDMSFAELLARPLEELRSYAAKKLKIVGASRIVGGKFALATKIREVVEMDEANARKASKK